MTKQEMFTLYKSLNQLGQLKGVKFAYAVSRNLKKIQPEIDAMDKSFEPSEDFKKFDEERVELAKTHAKKDANGEPETKNNQFIMEDQAVFEVEFTALREKYAEAVKEREDQAKEYDELLKTESSVELYKVKLENVPVDITAMQLHSINEIIEE